MTTYSCKETSLRENYPHEIIERDEAGNIVGTWTGYYNARAFVVTLYPSYKNPFFKWGTRRPDKIRVNAGFVKCAQKVTEPVRSSHDEDKPRRAVREVTGQVRMKI